MMTSAPLFGSVCEPYSEVEDTDEPGAVNVYFQKSGDGLGDSSLDGRLYEKKLARCRTTSKSPAE